MVTSLLQPHWSHIQVHRSRDRNRYSKDRYDMYTWPKAYYGKPVSQNSWVCYVSFWDPLVTWRSLRETVRIASQLSDKNDSRDCSSLTNLSLGPITFLSGPQMSKLKAFCGDNSWLYKLHTCNLAFSHPDETDYVQLRYPFRLGWNAGPAFSHCYSSTTLLIL